MNYFWILSILVLASVQAQFTPGQAPTCKLEDVINGPAYFTHDTYCQLFYQCDLGPNRFERQCANDTLWDPVTDTCNYPNKPNLCPSWHCNQTFMGTKYPDICCNAFWECDGSGFTKIQCPEGQDFQMSTGQCIFPANQAECKDHLKCTRFARNDGVQATCQNQPILTDICKYNTVTPTITYEGRLCPAGTSFNATACSCTNLEPACPSNEVTLSDNKLVDVQCRASMRTVFGVSKTGPEMYSDKLAAQLGLAEYKLPYQFSTVGYLSINNQGRLSVSAGGPSPLLYNYYFNLNQLTLPLGISVAFKYEGSTTENTEVQVLTNDVPSLSGGSICGQSTIDAKATYTAFNQQWAFTVILIGNTGRADTATANIRVNGATFLELLIMFDLTLSIQVIDRGPTGTETNMNTIQRPASNNINIGSYIDYTNCGLVICKGLNGLISKFNVYEGCGDFTRISL